MSGRAISSDQLVNVNSAEIWVTLDGAADYDRAVAAIQAAMHGYAGVQTHVVDYPAARIAQVASARPTTSSSGSTGPTWTCCSTRRNRCGRRWPGCPGWPRRLSG